MKALAFNGSPRPHGNTAELLRKALEGAASEGAETEFVQLRELKMESCAACFSCKLRGGKSYGRCALKDGFTRFYRKLEEADAVFLGSPIYFGAVTAEAKMFIDRLYPYATYGDPPTSFPKRLRVGLIYTMGVDAEGYRRFEQHVKNNERVISRLLGPSETLLSFDTFHVDDYAKIVADSLMPLVPRKRKHRVEEFPKDCSRAYGMGAEYAREAACGGPEE
jgi:multimeric flavodoxin WrbA